MLLHAVNHAACWLVVMVGGGRGGGGASRTRYSTGGLIRPSHVLTERTERPSPLSALIPCSTPADSDISRIQLVLNLRPLVGRGELEGGGGEGPVRMELGGAFFVLRAQ